MTLTVTRDPAMLAHLLTEELYVVSDESPAADSRAATLVLADYPGSARLPDTERDYLIKILASVDLEQDDVVILNYAADEHDFKKLKTAFNCSALLVFGVPPEKLGIPAPVSRYKITHLDGVDILVSDRLEQLRPDVARRKQLWTELRKMFREGRE